LRDAELSEVKKAYNTAFREQSMIKARSSFSSSSSSSTAIKPNNHSSHLNNSEHNPNTDDENSNINDSISVSSTTSVSSSLPARSALSSSSPTLSSASSQDTTELLNVLSALKCDKHTLIAASLLQAMRTKRMQASEVSIVSPSMRALFSEDVTSIIDDKLWLDEVASCFTDLDDSNADILRKYVLAALREPRAVMLQLVDVLLRMRAIKKEPLYQQQIYGLECLQLYAPLAHAVGIGKLMWELEDLSFRTLFPSAYRSIELWHSTVWQTAAMILESAKEQLMSALLPNKKLLGLVAGYSIQGRTKNLFSTFKKILRDNKNKEEVLDVVAMRVIIRLRSDSDDDDDDDVVVEEEEKEKEKEKQKQKQKQKELELERDEEEVSVESCEEVYNVVVSLWPEMPGRCKNYVREPKPNGYQSVHTTVMHPGGLPLEVQVRTEEMHRVAEYGNAAHSLYKGGVNVSSDTSEQERQSSMLSFAKHIRDENINCLHGSTDGESL